MTKKTPPCFFDGRQEMLAVTNGTADLVFIARKSQEQDYFESVATPDISAPIKWLWFPAFELNRKEGLINNGETDSSHFLFSLDFNKAKRLVLLHSDPEWSEKIYYLLEPLNSPAKALLRELLKDVPSKAPADSPVSTQGEEIPSEATASISQHHQESVDGDAVHSASSAWMNQDNNAMSDDSVTPTPELPQSDSTSATQPLADSPSEDTQTFFSPVQISPQREERLSSAPKVEEQYGGDFAASQQPTAPATQPLVVSSNAPYVRGTSDAFKQQLASLYPPLIEDIPQQLKHMKCWTLWGAKERDGGGVGKPPIGFYKGKWFLAKKNNPNSMRTFAEVWSLYQQYHGVKFLWHERERNIDSEITVMGIGVIVAPGSPLCGLDIDKCFDGMKWTTQNASLADYLAKSNTYVEFSPSGVGLRGFILWSYPKALKGDKVELYSGGARNEKDPYYFLTVTGRKLNDSPMILASGEDAEAIGQAFVRQHEKELAERKHRQHQQQPFHQEASRPPLQSLPQTAPTAPLHRAPKPQPRQQGYPYYRPLFSVQEVVGEAQKIPNICDIFNYLFNHASYEHTGEEGFEEDHSELDLSLLRKLAWLTDNNRQLMDACFRQSGLYRQKWERADYRDKSIDKAIADMLYTRRNNYEMKRELSTSECHPSIDSMYNEDNEWDSMGTSDSDFDYIFTGGGKEEKLVFSSIDNPFPMDALPYPAQEFVEACANAVGKKPGPFAMGLLVAVSSAIGTKVKLDVKRIWKPFCQLPVVLVSESGGGKTLVNTYIFKGFTEKQNKYREEYFAEKEDYDKRLLIYERDVKAFLKSSKDSLEEPPVKPQEPFMRRCKVNVSTPEKLMIDLSHNPQGLLVITNELSEIIGGFGKYSGGNKQAGKQDQSSLMSAMDGAAIDIARASREGDYITEEHSFVNVFTGTQKSILHKAFSEEDICNGFFPRLLLIPFEDDLYVPDEDQSEISEEQERIRDNLLTYLSDLDLEDYTKPNGEEGKRAQLLRFDASALRIKHRAYNSLRKQALYEGKHGNPMEKTLYDKSKNTLNSLIIILHGMEAFFKGWSSPLLPSLVEEDTVKRAVKILNWTITKRLQALDIWKRGNKKKKEKETITHIEELYVSLAKALLALLQQTHYVANDLQGNEFSFTPYTDILEYLKEHDSEAVGRGLDTAQKIGKLAEEEHHLMLKKSDSIRPTNMASNKKAPHTMRGICIYPADKQRLQDFVTAEVVDWETLAQIAQ